MSTHSLLIALAASVFSITGTQPVDSLRIPEGQAFLFSARAQGVQIYVGKLKASDSKSLEWVLKAPRADLLDQTGKKIGVHSAGPTWELNDGSKVVGDQPPKQRIASPNVGNIPWLLLEAKSHGGQGLLNRATYVLRVDTDAGIAPSLPPKREGEEIEVKYRATYIFLTTQ